MDAQKFEKYVLSVPMNILDLRELMIPSRDYSMSDEPHATSTDVSKSPFSLRAMELADAEAAAFGNVLHHCMDIGSIPRVRTSHVLRTRRRARETERITGVYVTFERVECIGTRSYVEGSSIEHELRQLSYFASDYADDILSTEGITPFLTVASRTRDKTDSALKHNIPLDDWVDIRKIIAMTGRSKMTVYRWIRKGEIPVREENGKKFVSLSHLRFYVASNHPFSSFDHEAEDESISAA